MLADICDDPWAAINESLPGLELMPCWDFEHGPAWRLLTSPTSDSCKNMKEIQIYTLESILPHGEEQTSSRTGLRICWAARNLKTTP